MVLLQAGNSQNNGLCEYRLTFLTQFNVENQHHELKAVLLIRYYPVYLHLTWIKGTADLIRTTVGLSIIPSGGINGTVPEVPRIGDYIHDLSKPGINLPCRLTDTVISNKSDQKIIKTPNLKSLEHNNPTGNSELSLAPNPCSSSGNGHKKVEYWLGKIVREEIEGGLSGEGWVDIDKCDELDGW